MTRRELAKVDRAMKRFADERKRINDFTPRSDGSGVEQNARLKRLDEVNKHVAQPWQPDWDRVGGYDEAQERRVAGFPSTFGRLAREAAEAPEPVEPESPLPTGLPYWLGRAAIVVACAAIVVLALACVKWALVNTGYIAP
jgi:hypothetical protein